MDKDLRDKSDEYWKAKLTPEQYHVLREKGTEPAFSGALYDNKEDGMYHCAACGAPLFSSEAKFDSGTGWPSFFKPVDNENVERAVDVSHGMRRVEVMCRRCGSHLGHVFPDGPKDMGGERFCINSCALDFQEGEENHRNVSS